MPQTEGRGESCRRIHSPLLRQTANEVGANDASELIRRYSPLGGSVPGAKQPIPQLIFIVAVFARGEPNFIAEHFAEVPGVIKSDGNGNIGDAIGFFT